MKIWQRTSFHISIISLFLRLFAFRQAAFYFLQGIHRKCKHCQVDTTSHFQLWNSKTCKIEIEGNTCLTGACWRDARCWQVEACNRFKLLRIAITVYSPSCLRQETGKGPFESSCHLPICLPHTVGASHSPFLLLNAKQGSCDYLFLSNLVWPYRKSNPSLPFQ